jgi:hypothetical protein
MQGLGKQSVRLNNQLSNNERGAAVIMSTFLVTILCLLLLFIAFDGMTILNAQVAVDAAGRAVLKCLVPTDAKGAEGQPCGEMKNTSAPRDPRIWSWWQHPDRKHEKSYVDYYTYKASVKDEEFGASFNKYSITEYKEQPIVSNAVTSLPVWEFEEKPSREYRYHKPIVKAERKGKVIPIYFPDSAARAEIGSKDETSGAYDFKENAAIFPSFDQAAEEKRGNDSYTGWQNAVLNNFNNKAFGVRKFENFTIKAGRSREFKFEGLNVSKIEDENGEPVTVDPGYACKDKYNCFAAGAAGGSYGANEKYNYAYVAIQAFAYITKVNNRAGPAMVRWGKTGSDGLKVDVVNSTDNINADVIDRNLGGRGSEKVTGNVWRNLWLRGPSGSVGSTEDSTSHSGIKVKRGESFTIKALLSADSGQDSAGNSFADATVDVYIFYYYDHYRVLSELPLTNFECTDKQLIPNQGVSCPTKDEVENCINSDGKTIGSYEDIDEKSGCEMGRKSIEAACDPSSGNYRNSFARVNSANGQELQDSTKQYYATFNPAGITPKSPQNAVSCGWKPTPVEVERVQFDGIAMSSAPQESGTKISCGYEPRVQYCNASFPAIADCSGVKEQIALSKSKYERWSNVPEAERGSSPDKPIFPANLKPLSESNFSREKPTKRSYQRLKRSLTEAERSCESNMVTVNSATTVKRLSQKKPPSVFSYPEVVSEKLFEGMAAEEVGNHVTVNLLSSQKRKLEGGSVFKGSPVMEVSLNLPTKDKAGNESCGSERKTLDEVLRYYATELEPGLTDKAAELFLEPPVLAQKDQFLGERYIPGAECDPTGKWSMKLQTERSCVATRDVQVGVMTNCGQMIALGDLPEPQVPAQCLRPDVRCTKELVDSVTNFASAPMAYVKQDDTIRQTVDNALSHSLVKNRNYDCNGAECVNISTEDLFNGKESAQDVQVKITYNVPLTGLAQRLFGREFLPVTFNKKEAYELSLTGTKVLQ